MIMEKFLKIGLVVKPQGVKGELKVKPLTDDPQRFKKLKKVLIDNVEYSVLGAKIAPDAVFLSIENCNDRNVAENFRNKFLLVKKEDAVELKENTFFIADIVNCDVYTESKKIGKIIDVTKAKTDFFTVETDENKIIRFPFLKDLLINVDIQNGKIIVKEQRFNEVSFYEDWHFNIISRNVCTT